MNTMQLYDFDKQNPRMSAHKQNAKIGVRA